MMIKDKIKQLGVKLGVDIRKAQDDYRLDLYKTLFDEQTLNRKPFYNVGSGDFYHPYWTNIDFVSDWYKGVQKNVIHHDLMGLTPIPIAPNSAKIIYTSHTIEHVKEDAVQRLFDQSFIALEKNGVFRITTGPDAITDFRALQNNDETWFYWEKYYEQEGSYEGIYTEPPSNRDLHERWLHHIASALCLHDVSPSKTKFNAEEIKKIIHEKGFPACLDYFCSFVEFNPERPGNHVSWWTHDKIITFLERAGFKKIYRSGFNQSVSPIMRHSRLFDSTHPQISIYVEAIK